LADHGVGLVLFVAAFSSVAITAGIVGILVYESTTFFAKVSLWEFFTDTIWSPTFLAPRFGILPLVAGTVVTTAVALTVALPIGTIVAIYLSEYAPALVRETLKPVLELLSAVPTVVYGYFALQFVTPLLQELIPGLPIFNMLSAGIVMGIMIIPYVSSLSEDAMSAVPMLLREGSYALGGNRLATSLRVVFPAALSGIAAAYILGISRAIGETMIVAIAAGGQPNLTLDPREPAETITAFIARISQGDLPHGSNGYQSIFAAGITLFCMTLAFNVLGFYLRKRYRQRY
jgi:phosphate transport system permease protein